MDLRLRHFLFVIALAGAAVAPPVGPATGQGTTPIPDFSGTWAHPYLTGMEPPASGPGPVRNKSRRRDGVANFNWLVGDYTNPILQPWAAEVVKKHGEVTLAGQGYPTPSNQCWPGGVPYVFWDFTVQIFQQPDHVLMIYRQGHELRHVRMNEPHPAQVVPSWYGDSVGHYEGDTLVIDTIGIKTGPHTMVDQFGTPHTQALHVIERYRLIDFDAAKEALERGAKENASFVRNDSGVMPDLNSKARHLQLQFTVEDEGAFTTPWSATVIYRPGLGAASPGEWPEAVCAENPHELSRHAALPTADNPDF
jgi:hypothetical protein